MKKATRTISLDKQYRHLFIPISSPIPCSEEATLRQPTPLKIVESKTVHAIGDAVAQEETWEK